MDLLKKKIHIEQMLSEAENQTTLSEDVNLPENKPDIAEIKLEKGEIVFEEIVPTQDRIDIRGYLAFEILYYTKEQGGRLVCFQGKAPLDEQLYMQGISEKDSVELKGNPEDLSIHMIHSRKLNVSAVINLHASVRKTEEIEAPMGLTQKEENENLQYRQIPCEFAVLTMAQKDMVKIKQEVTIPSNYPNIDEILWSNICLGEVEQKPSDGKLHLQGEVLLFVLYAAEDEEKSVHAFETLIPFSENVECKNCDSEIIPDVSLELVQKELAVRPDGDGEQRIVAIELDTKADIRLYKEETTDLLTDIYSVNSDIETKKTKVTLKKSMRRLGGKTKVTDYIKIHKEASVLQILHSEAQMLPPEMTLSEHGIILEGSVLVKVLYVSPEDEMPFGVYETQIPYSYTLEVRDVSQDCLQNLIAKIEQKQVAVADGDELEIKLVLGFAMTAFMKEEAEFIQEINENKADREKLLQMPGMIIYVVKPGDNLWSIGKKYYVTVDSIKENNDLSREDIYPGQKLLIMRV